MSAFARTKRLPSPVASAIARTRRLLGPVKIIAAGLLLTLSLCAYTSESLCDRFGLDSRVLHIHERTDRDRCNGWDPGAGRDNDPQECLKAKQYRQLEELLFNEELLPKLSPHASQHNLRSAGKLMACLTGQMSCPPRPLIISGYWYFTEATSAKNSGTTGEVIWMKSVQEQVDASGYITMGVNGYHEMVALSKWLPDLIHMVWTQDTQVVSCISDPRCITPEHWTPGDPQGNTTDPTEYVPKEELGAIPLWRLFATDYWGSMPGKQGPSWNLYNIGPDEKWSFNPLGQQWGIGPFDYPGHTWLPMSIEKSCKQAPFKPQAERNDSVLIYAKKIEYFDRREAPESTTWSWLLNHKDKARPWKIYSTAVNKGGEDKSELPLGIEPLGSQSRADYDRLISGVKVMLGIGSPAISPSVYNALCQGVPVVVPYYYDDAGPTPPGWALFNGWWGQHGPAAALGEPYVYSYKFDDKQDLLDKLNRAISTPIDRYIPPDLQWNNALARTRRFLDTDWHAAFLARVPPGGAIPASDPKIRKRCFELKRCRNVDPQNPFHQKWKEHCGLSRV